MESFVKDVASIAEEPSQESTKAFDVHARGTILTLSNLFSLDRNILKNRKITVDLSNTKYEIVRNVCCDLFGWSRSSGGGSEWNIKWQDFYINDDDLRRMLPFQKINHFPGSYSLGKKNYLGKHLTKMRSRLPEEYDFFPRTWLLPYQFEDLRAFQLKNKLKKPVFIAKPEASSQGRGIFLIKSSQNIRPDSHLVVQEYIKNPLLIDGLKFDFRVYVLLKSVNPLKVFVYREGLARFATTPYAKPSKKNLRNMCMHLTNYAVNKHSEDFQFNEDAAQDDVGHKRSFSSILKYLEQVGADADKVFLDIMQIVNKTMCAVQPYLSHLYRSAQLKEENHEMCFEVFGYINSKRQLSSTGRSSIVKQLPSEVARKTLSYEHRHVNGYRKAYPPNQDQDKLDYLTYISTAQEVHDEFPGTRKQKVSTNTEIDCQHLQLLPTQFKRVVKGIASARPSTAAPLHTLKRPSDPSTNPYGITATSEVNTSMEQGSSSSHGGGGGGVQQIQEGNYFSAPVATIPYRKHARLLSARVCHSKKAALSSVAEDFDVKEDVLLPQPTGEQSRFQEQFSWLKRDLQLAKDDADKGITSFRRQSSNFPSSLQNPLGIHSLKGSFQSNQPSVYQESSVKTSQFSPAITGVLQHTTRLHIQNNQQPLQSDFLNIQRAKIEPKNSLLVNTSLIQKELQIHFLPGGGGQQKKLKPSQGNTLSMHSFRTKPPMRFQQAQQLKLISGSQSNISSQIHHQQQMHRQPSQLIQYDASIILPFRGKPTTVGGKSSSAQINSLQTSMNNNSHNHPSLLHRTDQQTTMIFNSADHQRMRLTSAQMPFKNQQQENGYLVDNPATTAAANHFGFSSRKEKSLRVIHLEISTLNSIAHH